MYPSSLAMASVAIITSTTIVRRMRQGSWRGHVVETVVFGFMLLIALLIVAIVAPPVASILAYLGIVGAFVVNGPAVFQFLGSFGRGKAVL